MLEINPKKTVRKNKTYDLQSLFDFKFDDRLDSDEKNRITDSLDWKGKIQVSDKLEDIQKVDPLKETPKSLSLLTDKTGYSILIPSDAEGVITLQASFQVGEDIVTKQVTFNIAEDLSEKQVARSSKLRTVRSDKSRVVREKYSNPPRGRE
jgi:hypothetical protein